MNSQVSINLCLLSSLRDVMISCCSLDSLTNLSSYICKYLLIGLWICMCLYRCGLIIFCATDQVKFIPSITDDSLAFVPALCYYYRKLVPLHTCYLFLSLVISLISTEKYSSCCCCYCCCCCCCSCCYCCCLY